MQRGHDADPIAQLALQRQALDQQLERMRVVLVVERQRGQVVERGRHAATIADLARLVEHLVQQRGGAHVVAFGLGDDAQRVQRGDRTVAVALRAPDVAHLTQLAFATDETGQRGGVAQEPPPAKVSTS